MKHGLKLAYIALVCFAIFSTSTVYGAVIDDVMLFGSWDNDGNKIPQDVFTTQAEFVGI